jgi:hypothetical protein
VGFKSSEGITSLWTNPLERKLMRGWQRIGAVIAEGWLPQPEDTWADTTTPHGRLMLTVSRRLG